MKPFKCSVYSVIVVAVLIGSASGDTGGGDIGTPTTETIQCRIGTGRPFRITLNDELHHVLYRCLDRANSSFSPFSLRHVFEGNRLYFKDFCQILPTVKDCLAEESRNWANCYNDTLNAAYSIFVDVVETSLNKGCSNEGENLATIFDRFNHYLNDLPFNQGLVKECFMDGIYRWTTVKESNGAIPTKIVLTYKEIHKFTDCLIENIHDDDTMLSVVQDQFNVIIEKMNCIHLTDGSIVLCKTIDDALIDRASVCPLATESDISVPTSLILEGRATRCFIQKYSAPKLSELTTIEEFKSVFIYYCRIFQGTVKHCFDETTIAAGVCLHDAQYKTYKVVADNLNDVFNSACFDYGERLATMLHTAKTLKNSTTQNDSLMTCLATFQSKGTQQIYDDPVRIYAYYQALPAVRTCLTDNIQGDSTFIDDVNSFINDLMKNMRCLNPKDGAKVLCETLDQK